MARIARPRQQLCMRGPSCSPLQAAKRLVELALKKIVVLEFQGVRRSRKKKSAGRKPRCLKMRQDREIRNYNAAFKGLRGHDQIPVGSVESPTFGNPPLQGPAHRWGDLGMSAAELLEDSDRADAGRSLQHRHDLALSHP